MDYNSRVKQIFDALKTSHDAGPFTQLAGDIDSILDNFAQSSQSIFENIKADCDNNVGTEFSSIYSSVSTAVAGIKKETQKIMNVAPNVPALYNACDAHIKAVDEYNVAVAKIAVLENSEPRQSSWTDKEGKEHKNPDDATFHAQHSAWAKNLAAWRQEKGRAETEAKAKEAEALGLEGTILGILGATSTSSVSGVSGGVDLSEEYSIPLEDGSTKVGTRVVDANGNIISDQYKIVDTRGNVVKEFVASYTYNADGTKNESYVLKENGYTKVGTANYGSDDKIFKDTYTTTFEDGKKQVGIVTYNEDGTKTDNCTFTDLVGNVRESVVTYDADGKITRETYESTLANGGTQTGTVTFNSDGSKEDNYKFTNKAGDVREGTVSYDVDGKITQETYESTLANGGTQTGTITFNSDRSKEDNYKFTNKAGDVREGTVSYDVDGNPIEENYNCKFVNGGEQRGNISYADDGSKNENYVLTSGEDGTTRNGNVQYDINGNPVSQHYEVRNGDDLLTRGNIEYTQDGHTEKATIYIDGQAVKEVTNVYGTDGSLLNTSEEIFAANESNVSGVHTSSAGTVHGGGAGQRFGEPVLDATDTATGSEKTADLDTLVDDLLGDSGSESDDSQLAEQQVAETQKDELVEIMETEEEPPKNGTAVHTSSAGTVHGGGAGQRFGEPVLDATDTATGSEKTADLDTLVDDLLGDSGSESDDSQLAEQQVAETQKDELVEIMETEEEPPKNGTAVHTSSAGTVHGGGAGQRFGEPVLDATDTAAGSEKAADLDTLVDDLLGDSGGAENPETFGEPNGETLENGGMDGKTYSSRDAAVKSYMDKTGADLSTAIEVVDESIDSGATKIDETVNDKIAELQNLSAADLASAEVETGGGDGKTYSSPEEAIKSIMKQTGKGYEEASELFRNSLAEGYIEIGNPNEQSTVLQEASIPQAATVETEGADIDRSAAEKVVDESSSLGATAMETTNGGENLGGTNEIENNGANTVTETGGDYITNKTPMVSKNVYDLYSQLNDAYRSSGMPLNESGIRQMSDAALETLAKNGSITIGDTEYIIDPKTQSALRMGGFGR